MRISDWSSDVCSSDLVDITRAFGKYLVKRSVFQPKREMANRVPRLKIETLAPDNATHGGGGNERAAGRGRARRRLGHFPSTYWPNVEPKSLRQSFRLSVSSAARSEEHTSELQS